MASSGVNVLRYSALISGIGYGIYHQRFLTAKAAQEKVDAAFQHQLSLVQKAKQEWQHKLNPPPASGVITDISNPQFDLEKLMMKVADDPESI